MCSLRIRSTQQTLQKLDANRAVGLEQLKLKATSSLHNIVEQFNTHVSSTPPLSTVHLTPLKTFIQVFVGFRPPRFDDDLKDAKWSPLFVTQILGNSLVCLKAVLCRSRNEIVRESSERAP
jgi:hypothetical protein